MTGRYAPYNRTSVYSVARADKPKHMFVCIADQIAQHGLREAFALLDVGVASGDFLQYALTRFANLSATGLEYDAKLVDLAKSRVSGARFLHGDANRMTALNDSRFDAVTMTGTHSIFPDFRPSFGECIRVARRGGVVIITGIFNEHPVDAEIHWRYAGEFEAGWHPGYNLFSKKSVGLYLEQHGRVASFRFEPFTLPFDLEPQEDPIRSWTELDRDGRRELVNGIMPLNVQILIITIDDRGR